MTNCRAVGTCAGSGPGGDVRIAALRSNAFPVLKGALPAIISYNQNSERPDIGLLVSRGPRSSSGAMHDNVPG